MKRFRKKLFMYLIVAVLIIWPVLQIAELIGRKAPPEKAEKLLYQVSLFQMELLGSYLQETGKLKDTEALSALRQAVYSASFAHDHLALAYGDSSLAKLDSLAQLMQYLLRLQVGGSRPLRAEEAQTLGDVSKLYTDLYEAYAKLMSSGADIVGSQNDRLMKSDKAIADLLRKKLLQ
ncbi:S-adenosylmethionine decarboxylase [Paenibacillus elgii]|uniref:S-adenosylmethionine decarboxylase n=1 Tax=Paenibacillus elgii TaxID=189691 RepID=UPI0013D2FA46|nr:S-adenosylmethionine decarboxylase [Paenibacillus elgii]